ncbi:hypothetical protein HDIA_1750 [Hartmannibacter diazotrophicus]|uniref:Uncharacterized protein n=1 Tax=Hartmannibacter diazotrophicus TaxID=1482074 RepID=A0A2C9D6C3_9HYPH|nr:hypothetical protein [Hartmannibacter diazotrophicus]SON55291.1 hypothetical protein HDIA_1750 [Hartmannibacter diazotrophicus]
MATTARHSDAQGRKFVNGLPMRVIALVLAIAFGLLAWMIWRNAETVPLMMPQSAADLPLAAPSPAVADCVDKRLGEINRLVEQGLLSEDAARLTESRARQLCTGRN